MNTFEYTRRQKIGHASPTHIDATITPILLRLGGSIKFDVWPGGGGARGIRLGFMCAILTKLRAMRERKSTKNTGEKVFKSQKL